MPHSFTYSQENIHLLESVLGRLKHSVKPSQLIRWLENFQEPDLPNALRILRSFEYIDSGELLLRMDHLLKQLFNQIPPEKKIAFITFGKFGKSSTLITYPLTHLERFNKWEPTITVTPNCERVVDDREVDYIVFIDDFVGSGDTFVDYYRDVKSKIEDSGYSSSVFLLCPIIMEEAVGRIKITYPHIQIIGEIRYKYLESEMSPLKYSKFLTEIEAILISYGTKISDLPKGYDNSESLVAFFYGTPDNTFPIIWEDKNWHPIFPRKPNSILAASKLKRDVSYLLNTFFDVDFNLIEGDSIFQNSEDADKDQLKQNSNFFLLALLYLKYQSKFDIENSNLYICNFLGITKVELSYMYTEAKNRGFISERYELTTEAEKIIQQLLNHRKRNSIREISDKNLQIDNYLFLPKSFRGSS